MPYKSKAQAAYFNIHRNELEKEGVSVSEWNAASKGKSLPKYSGEAHSYDHKRPTKKIVSRYK